MTTTPSALVLGLGRSGCAAAELLRARGYAVTAVDRVPAPRLGERIAALQEQGVKLHAGCVELPGGTFDLGVVSPGIPADSTWLREARARCGEVLPELELGWRLAGARTVAVTGSNGKSTCVKLCAEMLRGGGIDAVPAGNYGTPVCELVHTGAACDTLVLELSTFQLETCVRFAPDVAVLLNVLPNHLDRHGSMDHYRALKLRLFRDLPAGATGVAPVDLLDAARSTAVAGDDVQWQAVGMEPGSGHWHWRDGVVHGPTGEAWCRVSGTHFDNPVLGGAAAAVAAVARAFHVAPTALERAARAFEPLPHRMQTVAVHRGVRIVDDSKATNLAALAAALRMTPGPVRLIAGGILKEGDLAAIKNLLATAVSAAYVVGEAMPTLVEAWGDVVPVHACGTLAQAVQGAWDDARPGEVILLSPACASFDQFSGYEDRGRAFQALVRRNMEVTGNEE